MKSKGTFDSTVSIADISEITGEWGQTRAAIKLSGHVMTGRAHENTV